jgi:hypothetical protein
MTEIQLSRGGLEYTTDEEGLAQLERGYAPLTMVEAAEAAKLWTPLESELVWQNCGDERPISSNSLHELETSARGLIDNGARIKSPASVTVSNFGTVPGLAQSLMAVGIRRYGENFYHETGGMTEFTQELGHLMIRSAQTEAAHGRTAVIPSLHTAIDSEKAAFLAVDQAGLSLPDRYVPSFCPVGTEPIGCARNEKIGLVSYLVGANEELQAIGQRDVSYVWGRIVDTSPLNASHAMLGQLAGQDYKFGRADYQESGLPIISLKGQHLDVKETAVMANFDPGHGSRPGEFYRMDAAAITLAACKALLPTGKELPAEEIMQSLLLTAVPTRSVLAKHGGDGNPLRLPLGVHFGAVANIDESLESIERELSVVRTA